MKKIANLYIALLALYYSQGAFYSEGSWLSRILLVIILIVSIYYFIFSIQHYSLPKPLKIMSFLLVVFTIYGLIPMVVGVGNITRDIAPFQYIKMIFLSQLPIYVFYVFWKERWIDESVIRRWFFVFLVVAIGGFYYSNSQALANALLMGSSAEEFTNNEGYTVLSLVCLIPFFNKRPMLQYTLLAICMAYVFMGFKRGAILTGALCVVWLIFQSFRVEKYSESQINSRKVLRVILVVVLVAVAVNGVEYVFETSDYINSRYERTLEGDSSNRDIMYKALFNHFINEDSILKFLFGNGAYGTALIYGNGAHNDWLEIAIDNGLVFLIVYIIYWISLLKLFFKGNRFSMATTVLGLFVILYFMKTMFSMSYNTVTPYAACAIAYAMVNYEYKDKLRRIA